MSKDPICYLHGLPGSAAELRLAGADRRVTTLSIGHPVLPTGKSRLVGFSLGAFRAMQIAARAPDRVSELVLISPPAPLQSGDFLDDMAGKAVFRLARFGPAFHAFTALQALALRIAPDRVLDQMLATASEDERALLSPILRRNILLAGLRQSLGPERSAYIRTIRAFVQDWRPILAQISCPVLIVHGGRDDWTPPAMVSALSQALPHGASVTRLQEAGHYGTLIHVLEGNVQNVWS